MIKQVYKVDDNGHYLAPVLLSETDDVPEDCILTPIPEGLYTPKWNNVEWVEGLTEEEIETVRSQSIEKTEMEILREENNLLKAQIQAASDRSDFHEELIAEMAMMIYS